VRATTGRTAHRTPGRSGPVGRRRDPHQHASYTISAAIWFGPTTGYLRLTGRYSIPRKFLLRHHAD